MKTKPTPINPGDVFRVRYPFVKTKVSLYNEEGGYEIDSWKPGVEFDTTGEYGAREYYAEADGEMILTVVGTHKPGKYPERAFFTRKWVDPDGKEFGKDKLRITTTTAFRSLTEGYRHHYELP